MHHTTDTPISGQRCAGSHRRQGRTAPTALIACIAVAGLTTGAAALMAAETVAREYQLKAAFLFNFTKFVEWPAERLAAPDAALVIGVFGSNPFGDTLQQAIQGRQVSGHPVIFRQINDIDAARDAHILFIAADKVECAADALTELAGSAVLTVGESEAASDNGCIIRFLVVNDQLRFEINVSAAERAGLRISSQLQQLAVRIVRP